MWGGVGKGSGGVIACHLILAICDHGHNPVCSINYSKPPPLKITESEVTVCKFSEVPLLKFEESTQGMGDSV